LYVIIRGRVSLSKDGEEVVSLGEREALGAWTLFEAEPRVMSALAAEETLLLRVDREDFYDLLLDYPELGQSILKALVRRLRRLIPKATP
ncbi:MAG: Crp/Fnr family transcriptional regulator, partial [Acidobacteriota bacterium]